MTFSVYANTSKLFSCKQEIALSHKLEYFKDISQRKSFCYMRNFFRKKKIPKHLKCSLTRAKDESHKRVDSSSLFLSLSLSLCVSLSLSLSLSLCPPPVDHDIGVEPLI